MHLLQDRPHLFGGFVIVSRCLYFVSSISSGVLTLRIGASICVRTPHAQYEPASETNVYTDSTFTRSSHNLVRSTGKSQRRHDVLIDRPLILASSALLDHALRA